MEENIERIQYNGKKPTALNLIKSKQVENFHKPSNFNLLIINREPTLFCYILEIMKSQKVVENTALWFLKKTHCEAKGNGFDSVQILINVKLGQAKIPKFDKYQTLIFTLFSDSIILFFLLRGYPLKRLSLGERVLTVSR